MHSRLPLIAGAPGRFSVIALTAALLATGCAPAFHAPDHDLEPASAAHILPAAVQNSADTTMREAVDVVVHRVIESHPAPETLGTAGQSTEPEGDTLESAEDTEDTAPGEDNDDDADDASSAAEQDQEHDQEDPEGEDNEASAREESLQEWSSSLTQAHEAAQENARLEAEARRQAEAEAEAEERRQAEQEADETSEDSSEQQAEPEESQAQEESQPPEAPESDQAPAPAPGEQPGNPTFTGDLDSYLSQLASSHPGRISISVQEVGGQGRSGSTAGADSFVTASTYKLLVAYSIIREVEAGERSWDDQALGDRSLAQCFQDMIAVSDNPCPEKLGPEIGWTKIYSDAAAMGASSTGGGEGGIRTNALDLTRFMTNLASGSMSMSGSGHETLRNALAANIHRQGVPAGSAGQVLNKPGFINGNLHDTAIVYHPSGTYVVTILSQGSSWESLASITRSIEAALYG